MHPEELTPKQAETAENPERLADLADAEFTALGRRARRVEGLRKSTGKEVYTDDIVLPGMLHGKILRSTEAHANIISIDTSEAEALEGVHAVITGRDMPIAYGIIGSSPAYSFTAHVAQVEVEPDTGFIDVKNIWVAHDCGRALNPALVEGQIEGSAYMGFAEAIFEEHVFMEGTAEGGLHNAPSLLDYRIPTSLDCPEFTALIVESVDPEGPYGAKEAGEGPLHPSLPAIANAIYDAVGVRMDELPFTPARVWRALRDAAAQDAREREEVA